MFEGTEMNEHVASLVKQFAENQVGDSDALDEAYDGLLECGPSVIEHLAEIVGDRSSDSRVAAATLIECFHPILDSTTALPVLRRGMADSDPFVRLACAEAIWYIEKRSDDVRGLVEEFAVSTDSELRRKARNLLETFGDVFP